MSLPSRVNLLRLIDLKIASYTKLCDYCPSFERRGRWRCSGRGLQSLQLCRWGSFVWCLDWGLQCSLWYLVLTVQYTTVFGCCCCLPRFAFTICVIRPLHYAFPELLHVFAHFDRCTAVSSLFCPYVQDIAQWSAVGYFLLVLVYRLQVHTHTTWECSGCFGHEFFCLTMRLTAYSVCDFGNLRRLTDDFSVCCCRVVCSFLR